MNIFSQTQVFFSFLSIKLNFDLKIKEFPFLKCLFLLLKGEMSKAEFENLYQKSLKGDFRNLRVKGKNLFYHYIEDQLVTKFNVNLVPTTFQQKIKFSFIPREYAILKITTQYKEEVYSKIMKGKGTGGISVFIIEKNLRRIEWQLKKEGKFIEKVSVIHTHPYFDYIIHNGKKIILHPLSAQDLSVGKKIFEKFGYPIDLLAITPTYLCYTVTFQN